MRIINQLRIDHLIKNFLILAPLTLLFDQQSQFTLIVFIKGFTTFSLLTLGCYLINDYSDKEIDKKNTIKKKFFLLSKKEFYILLFILIFFFILVSILFETLGNIYLLLYLINFLLYNYCFKKIKYFDLIFLNNFYFFRILYGSILFELYLSLGFLLFFFLFFFAMSTAKRVVQILLNDLKAKNMIIPYQKNDQSFLKSLVFIFFILTILLFVAYILQSHFNYIVYNNLFKETHVSLSNILLFFSIFFLWVSRSLYLIYFDKINADIYNYFLKDKISYILIGFLFVGLTITN